MQIDPPEVRRALDLLLEEDQPFEIRALEAVFDEDLEWRDPTIIAGFFDDPEAAVGQIARIGDAKGIYVTVNPVKEDLLGRCYNELAYTKKISGGLTTDEDVVRRRWMIVDVDPERPSGVSATDEEHERAIRAASTLAERLEDAGWPAPILASSGNGAHLLYRVDLPAGTDLVTRALEGLAAGAEKIGLEGVQIDTGVGSASQGAACYGTEKRKGSEVEKIGRLYRMARLITVPDELEVCGEELMKEAAPSQRPDPEPREHDRGPAPSGQNTGAPRRHGPRERSLDDFLQEWGLATCCA